MKSTADVVICGAGIAGISAAYHLAVHQGIRDILLVDERSPLTLTSDKSTECYRNWWPGPGDAMVSLMNRSIDLMETLAHQSGNIFHLNRRGYLYLTADPSKIPNLIQAAKEPPSLGAGVLRIHDGSPTAPAYQPVSSEGFEDQPGGADLILSQDLIRRYFPYLSEHVVAALHARRAGWFSAQQLGMYLLEQARSCGVTLAQAKVEAVGTTGGRVQQVRLDQGDTIATPSFVNAAGPYLQKVGRLLQVELPVFCELHLKVAFRDVNRVVDRAAPLLIWTDTQILPWSKDERELLLDDDNSRWMLQEMPAGVHTRPEGGSDSDILLMLWEYHSHVIEPIWPPPLDDQYPELVLRGLAAMVPGLQSYFHKATRPILDGGYYTKTRENRPLIGSLPVQGAYVIGALSGYGLMAACGAGELLAAHVAGAGLPAYAPAFSLERYSNSDYIRSIEGMVDSGQL
jgi:glycine/D-amino acid oxidase-like deaminating enzyme